MCRMLTETDQREGGRRERGKGAISRIHPNVGESEKKRDARRERWGRVCGRDWPWHTRSRYAYISPRGCHKTFHARHSVTPMITLPAIIIHASRANKFSRDGDDKNYYRPPWSAVRFRVFNKRVLHAYSAACDKKKKKSYRLFDTVDIGKPVYRFRFANYRSWLAGEGVTLRNCAFRDWYPGIWFQCNFNCCLTGMFISSVTKNFRISQIF